MNKFLIIAATIAMAFYTAYITAGPESQRDFNFSWPQAANTAPEINSIATEAMHQAVLAMEAGEYDAARKLATNAATVEPDWYRPHLLTAWTYVQQNRPDSAALYFNRLLQWPAAANHAMLGLAYIDYRNAEFEKAVNAAEVVIKDERKNAMAYAIKALALTGLKKWDDAKAECKKALRYNENEALAHYGLSLIYFDEENYAEADAHIELGMAQAGNWPAFSIQKAKLLYMSQSYAEAIQRLQQALYLAPNEPEAYLYQGFSYFYLQQYPNAMDAYKNSLTLDSLNFKALTGLGQSYYTTKAYNEALQVLGQSLEIQKDYYLTHFFIGLVFYNLQDYEQALEFFESTLIYDMRNQYALYNKALCLDYLERYDEARNAWMNFMSYATEVPLIEYANQRLAILNEIEN